jgi:hypothetical protein
VRDLVGMSGPTYQRAKTVVAMARDGRTPAGDPLTPAEQAAAAAALEQMNHTGKVTPAYRKATASRRPPARPAAASSSNGRAGGRHDPAVQVQRP